VTGREGGTPGRPVGIVSVAPSLGRAGASGRNDPRGLSPASQRHVRAVAILTPIEGLEGPMRAYLTVIGMALGLMAVWAALVPFVA
jgi:hypothetical protein